MHVQPSSSSRWGCWPEKGLRGEDLSINEQKNQLKLKPWPVRVDKDRKLDLSDFILFFLLDKKSKDKR